MADGRGVIAHAARSEFRYGRGFAVPSGWRSYIVCELLEDASSSNEQLRRLHVKTIWRAPDRYVLHVLRLSRGTSRCAKRPADAAFVVVRPGTG
jgi:hypothetical protein